LAWVYYNIGLIYKDRGDITQALERLEEALNIWHKLDNKQDQAKAAHTMASIYETEGNYGQALDHYRKALAIREELGNQKDIAEVRECIAAIEAKIAERET
jgi:tetratricopeptide (TPR) repeat protein